MVRDGISEDNSGHRGGDEAGEGTHNQNREQHLKDLEVGKSLASLRNKQLARALRARGRVEVEGAEDEVVLGLPFNNFLFTDTSSLHRESGSKESHYVGSHCSCKNSQK